jgi:chromosome partitioning protein
MIIGLVNRKGGVGKTTVSVHLYSYLKHQCGYNCLFVDADGQKSSSTWLSLMGEPATVYEEPDLILENLPDLAKDYDYTIIDGPATLGDTSKNIVLVADLVLIPCKPSGLDTNSTVQILKQLHSIQRVRGGLPQASLFLNLAIPNTRLLKESLDLLAQLNFPTLSTIVYQRQVICDAPGQGTTVWNLSGSAAKQAAADFAALFQEIVP